MSDEVKEEKTFWQKVWDVLKWILVGIGSAFLVILGLKSKKTSKQVEENSKVIGEAEKTRDVIAKDIAEIDKEVETSKKVVEEVKSVVEDIDSHHVGVEQAIKDSKAILEKYKR